MKKRIIALLLAVMLVLSLAAEGTVAKAETATNLKMEDTAWQSLQMAAGTELEVQLELTLKEGFCAEPDFSIKSENSSLSFKDIKAEDAEHPENPYFVISANNKVRLTYTIEVDDYAKIGTYKYYITYTGETYGNEDGVDSGMLEMEVSVVSEKIPPQIAVVSGTEFSGKAGEEVTLTFTLRNEGEIKALNTYVSVGYDDNVMIPTYTPLNQKVGDIAKGAAKTVKVSYKILEDATTQRVKLPVTVTYKDPNGNPVPGADYTLYLDIAGKEVPADQPAKLILNTVSQSPKAPKAGEKLTVTFNLENIGSADATDVKVLTTGLSSAGFEPINSEPYQYIGTVAAGTSKKVEVTVKVGEKIPEGLNTLNIQYEYTDVSGKVTTENVALNILNVQNSEEESTVSMPKLMISDFYTDVEEVKAGNVFDFTFELLNTNDEITAKNIKITVTSGDGTFSVTAGGNSFFVKEIKPGEIAPITINLKASAAATTKACPIDIRMEYEYEGMAVRPEGSGVDVTEKVLLQVKENLRPSVENVYVGWGSPTVNQASPMNFEFYNMGKSTLNNTYITIAGDFMLANGSNSYFVGNIAPGMPEYIEFDVIPLIEGDAKGVMTIHMEDSNGEEVTMEKEFTAFVMGEPTWENPNNGGSEFPVDPGLPTDTVPQDVVKPIVPLWIFLCIQGAILVIVIPVTRKIRLAVYRAKVKKEDEL